jgi:hypothetical protein
MVKLAEQNRHRTDLLLHREFFRDFALKHGDNMAISMLQDVP